MKLTVEKIPYYEYSSLYAVTRQWPRIVCPYHHHPEIELLYIEASQGSLLVGDHVGRFEAGDCLVLGAHLPHFLSNDVDWSGKATTHIIQFRKDALGDDFWLTPEMHPLAQWLEEASRGFRLSGEAARHMRATLPEIIKLSGLQRLVALLDLLRLIHEGAQPQKLASRSHRVDPSAAQDPRIETVLNYLHSSPLSDLSFEHALKLAAMTRPSFSRYFKQKTAMPFSQYVNQLRIAEASRLLSDTRIPILELATHCGFDNAAYFHRLFKRIHNLTPMQYRKIRQR